MERDLVRRRSLRPNLVMVPCSALSLAFLCCLEVEANLVILVRQLDDIGWLAPRACNLAELNALLANGALRHAHGEHVAISDCHLDTCHSEGRVLPGCLMN